MTVPRNILVIRLSSLGDVLLTIPAVKAIKLALPDSKVSWLVEGAVAPLLAAQDFIDRVIEFPRGRLQRSMKDGHFVSAGRTLFPFVKGLREKDYDLIVDFHGIVKSAVLSKISKTDRRIGFGRSVAKEGSWLVYDERTETPDRRMHKVMRNMLLVARLGATEVPAVELAVPADADASIDAFLHDAGLHGPIIAVNPFCSKGSEFKRWDLANYGALIRRAAEATGATMLILWGPGEEEEARRLKEMGGDHAALACSTTVPELLALIKRLDLYIGGDTGVMHLAALARVPVVAIFGPTDHLVNGPFGDGHTIIRKELPCSPCRDKSCADRICLSSISVDEVLDRVVAAWKAVGRN
jgi:lipopolysaccharide heptosyltransferase I